MKNKILVPFLLLTFTLSLPIFGQESLNFDALFTRWNDVNTLQPGVSVAIIKNDEVVFNKSFGFANLEYQIPLDNKSVFDIASLAKQFTGFAVAQLIIDEKLNLNDSASTYLPEIEILKKGVLLKHLIYHTSGLRDIGELFDLAYLGENLTSKDALEIIKNQQVFNFRIGTEYDYSNTNYVLLALIVERISKVSFKDWCAKNLFTPLTMMDSFVNDNPYEIIDHRAVAYYSSGSSFSFQQNNGMALIGSSAVYSTIDDMITWTRAVQGEKVFPEVFQLMKKKGSLDNGNEVGYGFGLAIGEYKNEIMIEHTGATPSGFRTANALFPNQKLALIVLSNWGNIEPIGDLGIKIIDSYLSEENAQNLDSDIATNPQKDIKLTKELIDRYVGEYLFNRELPVTISRGKADTLTIQLEGQQAVPIIPLSPNEFDLPALNSRLRFLVNAEGVYEKVEVWMGERREGELTRVNSSKKVPSDLDLRKYLGLFYSEELKITLELGLSEDKLAITNSKGGIVPLESKSKEIFIPENGIASSLDFIFNNSGNITGFFLNRGSRVRNLEFKRVTMF